MLSEGLSTLQMVWREHERLFHARDPFLDVHIPPTGGIRVTGSAVPIEP